MVPEQFAKTGVGAAQQVSARNPQSVGDVLSHLHGALRGVWSRSRPVPDGVGYCSVVERNPATSAASPYSKVSMAAERL